MSLETVAPISDRFGTGEAAVKAAGNGILAKDGTPPALGAEHDAAFQKLIGFLKEGSRDQREEIDGFDAMASLAGRGLNSDSTNNQVIQHPAMPTATLAAGAVAAGSTVAGAEMARQREAMLRNPGPVAKPIEAPKNANQFAANAQTVKEGAESKVASMQERKAELKNTVQDMNQKTAGAQPDARQGVGAGMVGMVATEAAFAAVGLPGAGMAVAAVAAVAKSMASPNIEGQGTLSSQKTSYGSSAIAPRGKRGERVMESMYKTSAPEPQAIAAPQPGISVASMNAQMGKGPGFGPSADLGPRGALASQMLGGIERVDMDKIIEKSPAMKAIVSQMNDGIGAKRTIDRMAENGLVTREGKQTADENLQAALKTPAVQIPTFRA